MKIKFKEERDTLLMGRVFPDKVYDSKELGLPKREFEAFVNNGVAVESKEGKKNGNTISSDC